VGLEKTPKIIENIGKIGVPERQFYRGYYGIILAKFQLSPDRYRENFDRNCHLREKGFGSRY
jgi:hypothetical protein